MKDDEKTQENEREDAEQEEVVATASEGAKSRGNEEFDDDEDELNDEGEEDDAAEAAAGSAPKKQHSRSPRAGSSARAKRSKRVHSTSRAGKSAAKSSGSSQLGLFVAIALIGGVALGWFARDARGKSNTEVHAATAGGEGPCKAWEDQVCEGAGAKSSACSQAKQAVELLPEAACGTALEDIPATLEKVKAARADCDKLVSKLCNDLGKETGTCKMVTERTESFPADRCTEMLKSYDKVLSQLKTMEERGGPGVPHGGPPGGPHGAPPPGAPHGGPTPHIVRPGGAATPPKAPPGGPANP